MQKGYKKFENITIIDFHSSGKGIGIYNNKKVYVPFSIQDENVDLLVEKRQKRGYISGNIINIKPSICRVEPFCAHYFDCGGCDWMHICYEYQLVFKRQILCNALKKYEIKHPPVPDVIFSKSTTYYRNKLDYYFSLDNEDKIIIGFHPLEKPYTVTPIENCFLMSEKVNEIVKNIVSLLKNKSISIYNYKENNGTLRNIVFRHNKNGNLMIIIGLTQYDDIINYLIEEIKKIDLVKSCYYTILTNPLKGYADGEMVHCFGTKYLEETSDNLIFRYGPKCFYQPNPYQADNIFKKVADYTSSSSSNVVYDLYCGIGTLSLYSAHANNYVIGIDASEESIDYAKMNAEINNKKNTEFITGDILNTFNQDFVNKKGKPNIIILDPPRSGTLIEIKKNIIWSETEKIVYVSCNPVSLAWDLKQLTEKYEIIEIQPYDMFPQTHHIETLVFLIKK